MGSYINLPENEIIEIYLSEKHTMKEICKLYNVSKYKILSIIRKNNIIRKTAKKYSYNEDIFENIDNEYKAYWLGFLYADGYVRQRKSSSELRLKLSTKDIDHLLEFRRFISIDNIPIKSYIKDNTKTSFISISSNKIVQDLINVGCVNKKSFIIKFPNIRQDLIHHFIRGYFDGDGWISNSVNNFRFGIVSGSKSMIIDINKYLCNSILINENNIYTVKNCFIINYSSVTDLIKIEKFLYKDALIYLKRKKDKFISINNYYENHKNKNSKKWN